jgi:undecaprenyl-diphosphatase
MEPGRTDSVTTGTVKPQQSADDRDLRGVQSALVPLFTSLASSVIFLILFAWISEVVFAGQLQRFDFAVRMKVHSFFNPGVTNFMLAITFLGSIRFLVSLFAILTAVWLAKGMVRPALWLAIAAGGSVILDISLKLSFHRLRPAPFVGAVPLTYSFPSGHALSSFCFYGVLAGLAGARAESRAMRVAIWIAAAALVCAIGLSRIYLGVHYPTDVLAGYIAAAAWVSTLLFASRSRRYSKSRRIGVHAAGARP